MKMKAILLALALGASASLVTAEEGQGPEGQRPPPPPPGAGVHVLPRGAAEKLNLTEDQKKQLTDLETEVKAKVAKILTPAQMEQLSQMRPPQGPGQRGPGGGQGGPQGQGGPGRRGPGGGEGGGKRPPSEN